MIVRLDDLDNAIQIIYVVFQVVDELIKDSFLFFIKA